MSVLDQLPAAAGLDETAAVCLDELARRALERGLFGAEDLALIETLRGVVGDYRREAERLVAFLAERDEDASVQQTGRIHTRNGPQKNREWGVKS